MITARNHKEPDNQALNKGGAGMKAFTRFTPLFLLIMAAIASPVHAYVGPGLGAGTLAVIAGIVASVFLAVFAVIWYPLKRILARIRSRDANSNETAIKKRE